MSYQPLYCATMFWGQYFSCLGDKLKLRQSFLMILLVFICYGLSLGWNWQVKINHIILYQTLNITKISRNTLRWFKFSSFHTNIMFVVVIYNYLGIINETKWMKLKIVTNKCCNNVINKIFLTCFNNVLWLRNVFKGSAPIVLFI